MAAEKKRNNSNLIKVIFSILMGISFGIFSCQQIVLYLEKFMVISCFVSFLIGGYITYKIYDRIGPYLKRNRNLIFLLLLITLVLVYSGYIQKGISFSQLFEENCLSLGLPSEVVSAFNIFGIVYYIASIPAVWMLVVVIFEYCKYFIKSIFDNLDKNEKKIYLFVAIFLMAVVSAVYLLQKEWFLQYDMVYSIDSGWCYDRIFPDLSYYDIRHPLISELTFPIWTLIRFFLETFAPQNLVQVLTGIFFQWINIWMLIFVGIMLRKMTNDIMLFYLYMCSFPTILFSFSLEKHQLCVFLLVSYVYSKLRKQSGSRGLLVLTAGVMPTNAFIGFIELLVKQSIKEKIKNIVQIFMIGLLVIIFFGRAHLIDPVNVYREISEMLSSFATGSLSISQRFFSVINMIESAFIALTSSVTEGQYFWESITEEIPLLAVVLTAFLILGSIIGRKEMFYRVCTVWVLFAFVLFVGLNWAPQESPLFTIIFSWAIIPLFVKGLNYMVEKISANKKLIYASILVFMLSLNIAAIFDISKFFG